MRSIFLSRRKKRKESTIIDTLTPLLPEHLRTLLAQAHARGETSITLEHAAFPFGDFSHMALTYCGFPASRWENSTLTEIDFRFSNLSGATFRKCDLTKAKLFGTGYTNTTWTDCDLSGILAPSCNFTFAQFEMSQINRTSFDASMLQDTTWRECNLTGASFRECDLTGATFIEGCLLPCDFTRANLTEALFQDCDLHEANLSWCNLTGAALHGSSLQGVNLYGAILEDVSFAWVGQLQAASLGSIAFACQQMFIHLGRHDCYRLLGVLTEKIKGNLVSIGLGDILSYSLERSEDEEQEGDDEDMRLRKAYHRDMTRVALNFCTGIIQHGAHTEGSPVASVLSGWLATFLEQ